MSSRTRFAASVVLQQKSSAKVWGTADKGEVVAVTFRAQTVSAKADDTGAWVVSIATGARVVHSR